MISQILFLMQESINTKYNTIKLNSEKIEFISGTLIDILKAGKRIFICGNGGSAADSQHFAAELVGRFEKERIGLPAIALTTDTSIITALANDYSYDIIFSRQLKSIGRPGDVLIGISTSGNSKNVIRAFKEAKKMNISTISFTGKSGGKLKKISDFSLQVQSNNTARIQETMITIFHIICNIIDSKFK